MKRLGRGPDMLMYVAAFITWLVVGAPLALDCARNPELLGKPAIISWWFGFLVFLPAILLVDRVEGARRKRQRILLAIATAAGLVCCFAVPFPVYGIPLPSILLVIVATSLLPAFRIGAAVLWVLGQSLLLGVSYSLVDRIVAANVVTITSAWIGFQLFGLFLSYILQRERETRMDLARTLAELEGTRGLLDERTRTAERVRISRELHDTLGHHLAALSLNLEAASHQDAGDARASVAQAQSITASMLAELRAVVSEMREQPIVDLARSVERLIEPIPRPQVHLTFAENLRIEDPELAQALFRITQEVLTNTIKHAGAANLWLEYDSSPEALRLVARDDGRGADDALDGSDLRGIHERATAHGGRVDVTAGDTGRGLRLEVSIPLTGGAP